MAYFGKEFVLSSQENFEAFVNSFGPDISDSIKQAVLNHKGTVKLSKNGDQYTLTTSQSAGSAKDVTFKSGVPFDDEISGHKAKTVITVKGDEVTTETKFENGTTHSVTRQFSDNQVVAIIRSSGFDGVAKRIYTA